MRRQSEPKGHFPQFSSKLGREDNKAYKEVTLETWISLDMIQKREKTEKKTAQEVSMGWREMIYLKLTKRKKKKKKN